MYNARSCDIRITYLHIYYWIDRIHVDPIIIHFPATNILLYLRDFPEYKRIYIKVHSSSIQVYPMKYISRIDSIL